MIHIKRGNTIKNIKLLKKDIYVDDNDKYYDRFLWLYYFNLLLVNIYKSRV
tara:strand:+ start:4512 stop:4664 length:153 start_codon:yes stop_codon:yes gene_type:complete